MSNFLTTAIPHIAGVFASGSGHELVSCIPLGEDDELWLPLKQALETVCYHLLNGMMNRL